MGRESLYYCSGNAFPGMIQWFFDIPSKLIHWRLNLVRALGATCRGCAVTTAP